MAERFLRMSHWVFDALMTVPMTKDELRVMMLIVKYTVGFHRYECDLSARFVARALDMSFQHASKCINSLKEKGFISQIAPGCGQHPAKISFNYKKFSVAFQAEVRRISSESASHFDTISVASMRQRKNKQIKNNTKEKKETLQATSFSLSREKEHIPEGEEWERMLAEEWDEEDEDGADLQV